MAKIEVDDDVFAMLQERARPLIDTASDVIRRLLAAAPTTAPPGSAAIPSATAKRKVFIRYGKLRGLIEDGLVSPGDRLIHVRKRTGETFDATVTTGGCIEVPGAPELFREPSPALRHYTGSQIDGWAFWIHEPSGRSLRDLRDNGKE